LESMSKLTKNNNFKVEQRHTLMRRTMIKTSDSTNSIGGMTYVRRFKERRAIARIRSAVGMTYGQSFKERRVTARIKSAV